MSCGVGHRLGWDLALLWLWRRLAAVALIWPLALELPHVTGVGLKSKKKKKIIKDKYSNSLEEWRAWKIFVLFSAIFPTPTQFLAHHSCPINICTVKFLLNGRAVMLSLMIHEIKTEWNQYRNSQKKTEDQVKKSTYRKFDI